jgi:branched-chain amino acid transport system substrate-binding protein
VAKAWAAYTNADGGLDGHPVTLTIKDTQGTPTGVQSAMTAMVNGGDSAIVLMDAAGASASTQTKVATVGEGTYNHPPWEKLPNYFSVTTSDNPGTRGYAFAAAAVGAKKMGEVVCAEVATCLASGATNKAQASLLGVDFTGVQQAAAADPSYTAQCLQQIQAGSQYLALGLTTTVWEKLAQECIQQGYKGWFGVIEGSFQQATMNTIKGARYAGEVNSFPWWVDNPVVQTFRDAVTKYSPSTDYRGTFQTAMWASLELIKAAVAGAKGNTSQAGVLAGFYTLKNETLGGLLPAPVTFTAGQPQALDYCQWFAAYNAGDASPKVVRLNLTGVSSQSNGAAGDLRSQCVNPLPAS